MSSLLALVTPLILATAEEEGGHAVEAFSDGGILAQFAWLIPVVPMVAAFAIAFFGKKSCPDGEIWLRDSDIVIVPKSHIQWTGDLIELIFTRGLYSVLPINGTFQLRNLSVL